MLIKFHNHFFFVCVGYMYYYDDYYFFLLLLLVCFTFALFFLGPSLLSLPHFTVTGILFIFIIFSLYFQEVYIFLRFVFEVMGGGGGRSITNVIFFGPFPYEIQWNLVITRSLGPWKLPCYIRFLIILGLKKKKYKELGPAKLPCYKRVLLYSTSL